MAWTVELFPNGEGNRRVFLAEATPNDSNKSLTFDDIVEGSILRLDMIRLVYAADAGTSGTRIPIVELMDVDGVVYLSIPFANTVTAGNSKIFQIWAPGFNLGVLAGVTVEHAPMNVWMARGHTLNVRDSAVVAPTTDDMTVQIQGLLV